MTLSLWRTLVEGGSALMLGALGGLSFVVAATSALRTHGDQSLRWKVALGSAALGLGLLVAFGFYGRAVVRAILGRIKNPAVS